MNPDPTMDADTQARVRASNASLAGTIAARRRVARGLLVPDHQPAVEVRKDWEPIRQAKDKDDTYRVRGDRPVTEGPSTAGKS